MFSLCFHFGFLENYQVQIAPVVFFLSLQIQPHTMSSTKLRVTFNDTIDENAYYKKFSQLPPKDVPTIRFIHHTTQDYFTVLNEDAEYLADNFYKTRSVIEESRKGKRFAVSLQNFKELVKLCVKPY